MYTHIIYIYILYIYIYIVCIYIYIYTSIQSIQTCPPTSPNSPNSYIYRLMRSFSMTFISAPVWSSSPKTFSGGEHAFWCRPSPTPVRHQSAWSGANLDRLEVSGPHVFLAVWMIGERLRLQVARSSFDGTLKILIKFGSWFGAVVRGVWRIAFQTGCTSFLRKPVRKYSGFLRKGGQV